MASKMSDNCEFSVNLGMFSKSAGHMLRFPNHQPPIFYQLCII